jgi:predicted ATPase
VEPNEKASVSLFLSTLTITTSDGNYQFFVLAVLLFQERPPHEAKRDEKKNILSVLRNET